VDGDIREVLNKDEALARAGGSKKILCRVLNVFLEHLPAMRNELQTSVAQMDAATIQRSAHTLKGSASVIGAVSATMAARELEMMAKSGKLDEIHCAMDRLDHELKRLIPDVLKLRDASVSQS
jgi:HPt (histidine-containing phosphotransfer) domain-containing protein